MPVFEVRVLAPHGGVEYLERTADSHEAAALDVIREGSTPLSVRIKEAGLAGRLNAPLGWHRGPGLTDAAFFCEQMASMLNAGLTSEQALHVLSKYDSLRFAVGLLREVRAGAALSASLRAHAKLPSYVAEMVSAGEATGTLAETFSESGRYLRRHAATRAHLVNSLTYPAVVCVAIALVVTFVLMIVVPAFEPLFEGEETRLPWLTRAVLGASGVVSNASAMFVCAAVIAAGFAAMTMGGHSNPLRKAIANMLFRLPGAQLIVRLDTARVLGLLGSLLAAGIEVSEAVRLASRVGATSPVREAFDGAATGLREGRTLSLALSAADVVPAESLAMIEIGEQTGTLGESTKRTAQLLDVSTSFQIDKWLAVANPLAILALGAIVALVVGGVMLGILSVNQLALG